MSKVVEQAPAAAAVEEHTESPFGGSTGWGRGRILRLVVFGLVLTGAAIGIYVATRARAPDAAVGGHNHGAAPTADSAKPVALSDRNEQRIGVTFAQAELRPLERSVRAVALVSYDETRVKTVAPKIDGWVEQLFVNFTGQAVRQGDPLFAIYSPMLVTAQQELLLAKRLGRDVAAGTPEAVQGASDLLESARRRLLYWEVPAATVQQIEATGDVQRTVTLRSPVAGVVVEKPVLSGQRIMAGDAVYKIVDLSEVWLEGEVFEKDLSVVRLGQRVTAEFTALPGETRAGRVAYLYPTINPDTRTARVRVALANPGLALKPGMYATIVFTSPTAEILSVPRSAVLSTGQRNLVFVRQPDGTLAPRDITPGLATDDRIQVLSGLKAGETVVASGTFLIDAESNLGSALGGMGNMPGMDVPAAKPPPRAAPADSPLVDGPGMNQPAPKKE
ncbi:MAG: efflux RND transporter periplasmic adaptor subunit [Gemmatimonadales bacterium]